LCAGIYFPFPTGAFPRRTRIRSRSPLFPPHWPVPSTPRFSVSTLAFFFFSRFPLPPFSGSPSFSAADDRGPPNKEPSSFSVVMHPPSSVFSPSCLGLFMVAHYLSLRSSRKRFFPALPGVLEPEQRGSLLTGLVVRSSRISSTTSATPTPYCPYLRFDPRALHFSVFFSTQTPPFGEKTLFSVPFFPTATDAVFTFAP